MSPRREEERPLRRPSASQLLPGDTVAAAAAAIETPLDGLRAAA
jgi:hypothetical protein